MTNTIATDHIFHSISNNGWDDYELIFVDKNTGSEQILKVSLDHKDLWALKIALDDVLNNGFQISEAI